MKKIIRNRGYIQVDFGVVNNKIQDSAVVYNTNNFAYYTNNDNLFVRRNNIEKYATFEKNYTKVDGTMRFLPRENSGINYYDSGLVGNDLVSDGNYEIQINTPYYEFKGLTLDFGDNFPKNFDIITENTTVEVRNNGSSEWVTQDVFDATNYVKVKVYEMATPENRFRVNYILFGYGLSYGNDYVIDSNLESYVSPIGADVPQIDFKVVLNNDNYFNVDDPNSAVNYLETGQTVTVRYGLQVGENENEIEWVKGCKLCCSSWETDDATATIYAQDIFRSMDTEYYFGRYYQNGISYYDLAEDVLLFAGETNYYIDPILKNISTRLPLPRVTCKEALQIIANACRCVLDQTRDGTVSIKSNFKPLRLISCNGETSYSNVGAVLNETPKNEYASFSKDYTKINNSMYFLDRGGVVDITTGYISNVQSDENSEFQTNPVLTISQNAQHSCSNLRIIFGNSKPSEFVIRTYNDNALIETVSFPNEEYETITKDMTITHEFYDFDKLEIEFIKTEKPYNRITVNNISLEDTYNYTLTLNDIISSPKAIKQERVQEVVVPYRVYQQGGALETLHRETVSIQTSGTILDFYFGEPCYDYEVTLDGSTQYVVLIDPDFCWKLSVRINTTGTHVIEIKGRKYKITENQVSRKLYESGKEGTTKKWLNPLVEDAQTAQNLCDWLCEYYRSPIEYEYQTRGNPELDVNDTIYQERKTQNEIKTVDVIVCRHAITFNGAFGGFVTARRLGDDVS